MEQSKKERFMQLYAPVHDRFERYCKTRAYGEFHFKDIMHDTLLVAFENFDKIKSKDAFLLACCTRETPILLSKIAFLGFLAPRLLSGAAPD